MKIVPLAATFLCAFASPALAAELVVPMHKVSETGIGDNIGSIVIAERGQGLVLKIAVTGIATGPHGFHLHEKGDCNPGIKDGKQEAAMAAGSHFDPLSAKSHQGPGGSGHKGDLPLLKAADGGINATFDVVHLKMADFHGRSLILHEGSDNYSDLPENGGGKGRIACGVVPAS